MESGGKRIRRKTDEVRKDLKHWESDSDENMESTENPRLGSRIVNEGSYESMKEYP